MHFAQTVLLNWSTDEQSNCLFGDPITAESNVNIILVPSSDIIPDINIDNGRIDVFDATLIILCKLLYSIEDGTNLIIKQPDIFIEIIKDADNSEYWSK